MSEGRWVYSASGSKYEAAAQEKKTRRPQTAKRAVCEDKAQIPRAASKKSGKTGAMKPLEYVWSIALMLLPAAGWVFMIIWTLDPLQKPAKRTLAKWFLIFLFGLPMLVIGVYFILEALYIVAPIYIYGVELLD